jgi:hypothetical protein
LSDHQVAKTNVAVTDVAVTQSSAGRSHYGSAVVWLAAAVLLIAPAGLALAQNNTPAPAGLAPSGDAGASQRSTQPAAAASQPAPAGAPSTLTLPPQPAPPQAANQATNPGQRQAPNQAPNQAATQAPDQAAAPPPSANDKRGFLNDFGQWWNDSIANFGAKMKEQQTKLDEFNKQQSDAAKDAGQAMKKAAGAMFSPSKVIEIQQLCPTAGNGAPDCATAATNVCKGKGFSAGQPIDIRTAERCKASLWVSGQNPTIADCPVETVLLRVACQQ